MYAEECVSRAKYARHNVKQIQKRKSTMRACATRAKETRKIYVRTRSVNLTIIINDSSFSCRTVVND